MSIIAHRLPDSTPPGDLPADLASPNSRDLALSDCLNSAFGGASDRPLLGIHGRNLSSRSRSGQTDSLFFIRFALQSAARELLKREAVATCMRRVIPHGNASEVLPRLDRRVPRHERRSVDVYRSVKGEQASASFGGLQTCRSVWHCPVCAAKISERRREELSQGLNNWSGLLDGAGDRRVLLVTLTMQHSGGELLAAVLGRVKKARTRLLSGRDWQDFKRRYRLVGQVRSLELTYGVSGWHVHLHVLMFFDAEVPIIPFEAELKVRWMQAAEFAGGYASYDHGCDVRYSDKDIADYIAKFGREPKWTAAHEVAKAVAKGGRGESRSPMELLRDYFLGDEAAGRLWLQYAITMKGERQLFWSQGLRLLLGLGSEKTDSELVEEVEESSVLFAELTRDQWLSILRRDLRARVLELAAAGDEHAFWLSLWLAGVPSCPVSVVSPLVGTELGPS